MQTRLVAAASGVLVALGFSLLALRSSGAQTGTDDARQPIGSQPAALPSAPPAAHAGTTRAPHQSAPRATAPTPQTEADAALQLDNRDQRTAALCDALALWSTADAGGALV